jgi:hypothetical protein
MNTTAWLKSLQVTADGTGTMSRAGVAQLRALADKHRPDRWAVSGAGLGPAASL